MSDLPQIVVGDPQRQRRRSSGLGRFLMQLTFFLASLIPMCIVAWKFDAVGLLRDRQPQQPPPQQIIQPPAPQIIVREPAPRQRTEPRAEPRADPTPAVVKDTPPPAREVERKPVKTLPTQLVTLDLENKRQRESITLERPLKIARIEGYAHSLNPSDGSLDEEVVVTINGPRPILLTVAIDSDDHLFVTPTVRTDAGKDVSFTRKNLNSIGRVIVRRGRRAANQVAALEAEKAELEAWLNSPLMKPIAAKKNAQLRIKQIDGLIREGQAVIASLERELRATEELAHWAEELDGKCAMVIEGSEPTKAP